MISETERVRALLDQALAEANWRGVKRISCFRLVLYDSEPGKETSLIEAFQEMARGTIAEEAEVIVRRGPSRYICWNCCGLRYESEEWEAVCSNCGHEGLLIPRDVTFALEDVEME